MGIMKQFKNLKQLFHRTPKEGTSLGTSLPQRGPPEPEREVTSKVTSPRKKRPSQRSSRIQRKSRNRVTICATRKEIAAAKQSAKSLDVSLSQLTKEVWEYVRLKIDREKFLLKIKKRRKVKVLAWLDPREED